MAHKNLTRDKEKGKYGFKDEAGNWIISPIFMKADDFDRRSARVQIDEMWGFINEDGSWLVEPTLSDASPFSDELARVRKDFFYGFINRKGEWFIEPKLLNASNFENDSIAYVENLDSRCAFISNKGKMITDFNLDHMACDSPAIFMSDGRIRACKDGNFGFLDAEGNWAVPPIYEEVLRYTEGRTFAKSTSNPSSFPYDMIDVDGNTILKFISLEAFNFGFEDGLAIIEVPVGEDDPNKYLIGRCGVIDRSGKWIVPPVFGRIHKFRNGFAITEKHGKKGVIDKEGNIIIENLYDRIIVNSDHFIIELNNKKGIADRNGKVILEPKYKYCELRKDGFITIRTNKGYGLADMKGKVVVKPTLDSEPECEVKTDTSDSHDLNTPDGERKDTNDDHIVLVINNKDGGEKIDPADIQDMLFYNTETHYLWAKVKGKWGYLDSDGGRWVIKPKYKAVEFFDNSDSLIRVKHEGKWGVIDARENWLIPPVFDSAFDISGSFDHGLVLVKTEGKQGFYDVLNKKWALNPIYQKSDYVDNNLFLVKENGKFGFSDSEGQIIEDKWYDDIFQGRGVVWVKENGKYGVMDKSRTWLLKPTFDWIDYQFVLFNRDGIIRVEIDGRMALADTRGNILGDRTYKGMHPYSNGFFKVVENDKYGLIDRQGNLVVPTEYYDVEPYYNGLALAVTLDKKYGFIGKDGEWKILPRFDWAESFCSKQGSLPNYVRVMMEEKYGIIDRKGNWAIGPKYEKIGKIYNILSVRENGKYGYLTLDGEWLVPPIYLEVDDFCNGYGSVLTDDFKRLYVDTTGKLYKRKPN